MIIFIIIIYFIYIINQLIDNTFFIFDIFKLLRGVGVEIVERDNIL
jgi:hypothetical protein